MIHPHTATGLVSPAVGNGVFATRFIPAGTIVVVRDRFDLCMSRQEFEGLPPLVRQSMEVHMYHDKGGNLVLSWDNAKFMNHCCHSNTKMTDYGLEIAVRDIREGEEITSEYGLLNVQEPYDICCVCPDCRGRLRLDDIDNFGDEWDEQILHALTLVPEVDQPLWELVPTGTREEIASLGCNPGGYRSVKNLKWRLKAA